MDAAFDQIWISAAAQLGIEVVRGGDSYVHFDGARLHIATDEHLDADDTVAQLIFHELCHALVQGPANRHLPDWGLDQTSGRDEVKELGALRLQAHFSRFYGLRKVFFPTTVWRAFFEALPLDALRPPGEESCELARKAALWSAKEPWQSAIRGGLEASARRLGGARHPLSGHPLAESGTCAACTWRTEDGICRQAPGETWVDEAERACVRLEVALDCQECGACCRSAYDSVEVSRQDPVNELRPEMIEDRGSYLRLRRLGDRCAALEGPAGGPFCCSIYLDRPQTCRDFESGGRHCLDARRKVGLSF